MIVRLFRPMGGAFPPADRNRGTLYFERMKRIVEEHGGSVEKFIGDAVMAVFGVARGARGRRLRPAGRRW
jgi:hypothetical protein